MVLDDMMASELVVVARWDICLDDVGMKEGNWKLSIDRDLSERGIKARKVD